MENIIYRQNGSPSSSASFLTPNKLNANNRNNNNVKIFNSTVYSSANLSSSNITKLKFFSQNQNLNRRKSVSNQNLAILDLNSNYILNHHQQQQSNPSKIYLKSPQKNNNYHYHNHQSSGINYIKNINSSLTNLKLNLSKNQLNVSSNLLLRNFELEERDKIVVYTTSLQTVRLSYDKSKKLKKIMQNHCVRFEERDLNKNKEFQKELKYRLNINQVDVPHLFFNGKHIGVI
jgi:glutaredoxin